VRLAECARDIAAESNISATAAEIGAATGADWYVANASGGRVRLNRRGAMRRFEGVGSSDFAIEVRKD